MDSILKNVKFDGSGLVPAVAQDYISGQVLMVAYMNEESLARTIETGLAHYWSRSRSKLWLKGETSGHYQHVKSIAVDCDGDTLLLKIEQTGNACHTGHTSCFYRTLDSEGVKEIDENTAAQNKKAEDKTAIMQELYDIIVDRTVNPKEGSYTNYLFEKGLDKILKKVGEESAEVIIAAKNKSKSEIRYEIADLYYHLFVLMVERGLKLDDIYEELKGRR